MSTDSKKLNRSRNPMDFTFNDVEQLSRFITETGKILPRKDTGLSAKHAVSCVTNIGLSNPSS